MKCLGHRGRASREATGRVEHASHRRNGLAPQERPCAPLRTRVGAIRISGWSPRSLRVRTGFRSCVKGCRRSRITHNRARCVQSGTTTPAPRFARRGGWNACAWPAAGRLRRRAVRPRCLRWRCRGLRVSRPSRPSRRRSDPRGGVSVPRGPGPPSFSPRVVSGAPRGAAGPVATGARRAWRRGGFRRSTRRGPRRGRRRRSCRPR